MSRRTRRILASRIGASAGSVRAAIALPSGMTLEQLREKLCAAATAKFGTGMYAWVEATFDGSVVLNVGNEKRRYSWSMDGDTVALSGDGEPVEARTDYVTVTASVGARIVAGKGKRKALARVTAAGEGLNSEHGLRWYVPDTEEGLGSLVKPMGGAKVHMGKVGASLDHRRDGSSLGDYLDAGHEIGYLSDVAWASGEVTAVINFADDVPDDVVDTLISQQIGLSIEASADRRPAIREGKAVVELINFRHGAEPASVAVVSNPALAGEILRVAASRKESPMNRDQALAILASTTATAEQVAEARRVLAATATPAPAATATATIDPDIEASRKRARDAAEAAEAAATEIRASAARAYVASRFEQAGLPDKLREFGMRAFVSEIAKGTRPTDAAIDAEINSIRAAVAPNDARVTGSGAQVGAGAREKTALRLESLFGRNDPAWRRQVIASRFDGGTSLEDRRHAAGLPRRDTRDGSFLRIFREGTGQEFSDLRGPRSAEVRASIISTTFGDAWENVLNRRFIGSFENPDFSDWRKLCRVVPLQNFVKQERMIKGGYANLETVAEGQNYQALTSPADQGHGYTPTKRGGTEAVSWEAMLRDDVGALDVGPALGMAAARTLYEFVLDLYSPAGSAVTMDYDSTALYHANHGNTGTTALAAAELIVVYKAMLKQADISNSKRLMVVPKYLIVPIDLMNTAFDLLKSLVTFPGGSTVDQEFIRKMQLEAIVARHWTDATNWAVAANPHEYPAAEIGFVGGSEEPELFIQDDRNIGSLFNSDQVTYKVRHPYGGTILRHETVYGETVAG